MPRGADSSTDTCTLSAAIARDLGFGGVVICGDLWNRFDMHNHQDYKELIAHFDKLRKATG